MATPHDHSGPIRTCVGCRARRPQAELLRCVLGDDGRAHVDRRGPGRGAWLCGPGCLDEARRRRGFERAWRVDGRLHPNVLDELGRELPGRN